MFGFQNYTLEDFSRDIQEIVHEELDYQFLGSSQGTVDPEQLLRMPNVKEIRFILKTYGLKDLQLLSISSWFFKKDFKTLLQIDIDERLSHCGDDITKNTTYPLLSSQNSSLEFYYYHCQYSRETWFGQLRKRLKVLLKLLRIKVLKENPNSHIKRYSGYCSGYSSSRPAKSIEKQVLLNDILYYQRKFQSDAIEKLENLDQLLFCAGLNDNQKEISRLLSEKAKQVFLRDLKF